ncbi:MAG: HAMP domain-containing protein, partial [Lachnospiraceae bacterium]|nr:HAMP domain-containing protein [Lachnospiraceae bacterium]
MKHSIKRQFTIIFVSVLALSVMLTAIANLVFLKRYYIFNKTNDINLAYDMLKNGVEEGRIDDFKFHEEMLLFCEERDISIVVIDNDLNLVLSVRNDKDMLDMVMNSGSFSFWSKDDVNNMKVHVFNDPDTNARNLGKRGYINDNYSFLIKCPVLSIQEYVDITNRFYIAVSALGLIAGVTAIVILTHRYTQPIVKLNEISSKVANLDFDTKYNYTANNEIDELGKNINEMSEKLEKTISELKSANAELMRDIERKNRNEEMRKEFLANVSHELKTPIALIQSYSEGLKDGIISDEKDREYYLSVINDEASRMNSIVKEIMSLSRLEYGYDPFEIERFDIVEMINNKLSSTEYMFKQKEVNVVFEN